MRARRSRGIEVVTVAPTGPFQVLARVDGLAPDLVLHDLDLGAAGDGTEHVRRLTAAGHRVLMVTGVDDPVRHGRCIEVGAIGIVDKGQSFDDLVAAIDRVLHGRPPMDPRDRDAYLSALLSTGTTNASGWTRSNSSRDARPRSWASCWRATPSPTSPARSRCR